jgi:hypothetical protein
MKYTKTQILGLFLIVLVLSIIYSDYFFTILYSIFFALSIQAAGLYIIYRLSLRPKQECEEESYEDNFIDSEREILDLQPKISSRSLVRKKTNMPCLCHSENFKILCSGSDKTMPRLLTIFENLLANDKNFANSLEKACESTVLDKITNKNKGLLSDL